MREPSPPAPAGGSPVAARALSRRHVLVAGAVAVVGAVAGRPGRAAAGESTTGGPSWLRRSTHVPHVGSRYTAHTAAGGAGLDLVTVDDLRGRTAGGAGVRGRDDAFVLAFRGRPGLAQGVYRVDHPAAGGFDALVVPGLVDAGGARYAVVVNRAAPAG